MGKRGNIAQVRNCIEYDFVPNNLTITDNDIIHFQWIGSDFNPLNNDGEGRSGTDRTNLVDITDYYGFNRIHNMEYSSMIPRDLIDSFIYLHQLDENCYNFTELTLLNKIKNTQDIRNCALLNNASVYFNSRIFKINSTNSTYKYMSTRNNNFSNRDMKGILIVLSSNLQYGLQLMTNSTNSTNIISIGYIALIIVSCIIVLMSLIYYKKYTKEIHHTISTIKRNIIQKV